MKKILLLLAFLTLGSIRLLAQAPPPPPASGSSNGTNGIVGGSEGPGTPVGNGTFILVILAAVYTGRKVYETRARPEVE
jgi:hypothetical protein